MTRDEIEKEFYVFKKHFNPITSSLLLDPESCSVIFAEHILRAAEQKRWQPIETAPTHRPIIISGTIAIHYPDKGWFVPNEGWRILRDWNHPKEWQPIPIAPAVKS